MNTPIYNADQIIAAIDEKTKTVTKTIAARLIGCDLGLITYKIRKGELSVLPNDRLLLSEVENVAGRPIKPIEVQLCEVEQQYKNQYLANEQRLRLEMEAVAARIAALRDPDNYDNELENDE